MGVDRITIADIEGLATITVPMAGKLVGLSQDAAYDAARRGEIPTLRFGRRIVVPVPRLMDLIGAADHPALHIDMEELR